MVRFSFYLICKKRKSNLNLINSRKIKNQKFSFFIVFSKIFFSNRIFFRCEFSHHFFRNRRLSLIIIDFFPKSMRKLNRKFPGNFPKKHPVSKMWKKSKNSTKKANKHQDRDRENEWMIFTTESKTEKQRSLMVIDSFYFLESLFS